MLFFMHISPRWGFGPGGITLTIDISPRWGLLSSVFSTFYIDTILSQKRALLKKYKNRPIFHRCDHEVIYLLRSL